MTDSDQQTAIVPAINKAITPANSSKVILPVAGTAALVWAGRKALALARHLIKQRQQRVIPPQPTPIEDQPKPLILIRHTRVTIHVHRKEKDQ